MSKSNPYPTHYKDQPKAPKGYEDNAPHSQGGQENLPEQHYDSADDFGDGAKGWKPDYSEYR
jgi:hypothetical protein